MLQAYLVDDEPHALNMLEMFLKRTGAVQIVGRWMNGFEALKALDDVRPDIWFVDIEMPGMSGLELAANIHEIDPEAIIVFVTAYDQYAVAAFEHEALDYLLKPIEMGRLSRTIDRILREREREQEKQEQMQKKQEEEARGLIQSCVNSSDNAVNRQGSDVIDGGSCLFVQMFGKLRVTPTNGGSVMWRTAKEKELFAYLLLQDPDAHAVHRDRIVEHLWPDERYEKAKIYMHTCVSLLRKNLKKLGMEQMISYRNEHYIMDKKRIRADVYDVLDVVHRMQREEHVPLEQMERTLYMYQDELLAQEDYPWVHELGQRLERSVLELMLKLSEMQLARGNGKKAIEAAERAMVHSPYEEEAYRCAMQAYLSLGKHDQVLRIYRDLEARLQELHIGPSIVSRRLYEQIQM
ncbi:response regulator [Paenibacillus barcinonensis]|uniref:Response regulator n=1 Tax=Paenibacillus barcinonensis TaxID=198119 RepID=A0A2V4W4R4_PAEBA|nr:response regulator [Paenibacillus barcinonensis]PYE49656.1 two-component SAPR family response regulator [Paenibacillus barcinonensis]QKS56637.1 response regulator [Paenibacillus barcinonensis]